MKSSVLHQMIRISLLLALFATSHLASAQSGKIAGTVIDDLTGDPLPGVNITIQGTTQGTSTDLDGNYVIIGIRPGTYAIEASYIGFATQVVSGVRVNIDLTSRVNFTMTEEVIAGEEVVIVAERPMIQKDVTATTAVVSGDQIRAIPVENFGDVVELQAGVVDGHFRGGRTGEVGYWVDGLPVTDVYNGGLTLAIENNTVEELQVVTGAFNAEYGQAMSGIVNVVTRDGSNKLSGGVSYFTGDYAVATTAIFQELGGIEPGVVQNVEADFSGPILKEKLFFFVSGRYFSNDGWFTGRNVYGFNDVGKDVNTGRLLRKESIGLSNAGDSSLVNMNPFERRSGQAKLTWRISPSLRLVGNIISSEEVFKLNSHDLTYFPDARLNGGNTAQSAYLKFTHTLSNTTFYEVGYTNTISEYEQYLFETADDERYRDSQFFEFTDYLFTAGFRVGGTNNSRFSRSTQTNLVKLDLSSQIATAHLLKTGVEFRQHTLTYNDDYVVKVYETGDQFLATNGRYTYKPIELSAYMQDKIEFGNLIVNLGLRFDYFDSKGRLLSSSTDPDIVYPKNRPDNVEDYTVLADPKWQVSPRIGVAFPITEKGVIHFSYGHFFQRPSFELLYSNPYFNLGTSSGLIGLLGNANLEPEHTINGEIGLKQEIADGLAVELTAYYRDIRNLTGTATDPIQIEGTTSRYGILQNSDFGFVRGVVARFDVRLGSGFFITADYTYQIARANSSDPSQVYNAAAARQQLETQIVPTNWDQRHTANFSLSYRTKGGLGVGFIGRYGSGLPYTPQRSTLQTGDIVPTRIPLNSEFRPSTYSIDLSLSKDVVLAGQHTLQLFGRVDNLLDTRNEVGVFGDTGRAGYSLQQSVDARTFRGDDVILNRWYNRADFYNEPRRVVAGLRYRF